MSHSLEELCLALFVKDASVTDGLIEMFTIQDGTSAPVCPHLTVFKLDVQMLGSHYDARTNTKDAILADMVDSRWAVFSGDTTRCSQLTSVGVRSSHHPRQDLERLEKYSREGLEVEFF